MEQFVRMRGIAAALLRINIDTNQLAPDEEHFRAFKEGWAGGLLAGWRYLDGRVPDPSFILNQQPYCDAKILLADRNFGCGSSRETAPEAIRAWGLRSVIAPSFGGIFFNNCFRKGVLPIEMPIDLVRELVDEVTASGGKSEVDIDLEAQIVTFPSRKEVGFRTPPLLRRMLLSGADEIEVTLSFAPEIKAYRDKDRIERPWIYREARS